MANEFKVKNGLIVSGSADIEQDLRVRGTLTVDEFHTSITTSSIIYESGSTRFGNSLDDAHNITGSVNITGSISLNGEPIGTGKLDETTFNTYTSSYKVATVDFNNLTTSYNSFSTSYISASSSFNSRVSGLESFSSSLDVSFVNEVEFGSFSSSIKNFTSSLNSYTNSLENRLSIIESSTGSLNSFSSSINSFSNSINTTIKNKLNVDGVISGSSQILNGSNLVSSSAQVTAYGFAITGSNTFKGEQYVSGSIIPTIDNAFDLGSPQYQWRDVYISSGSLYIDNTKVLSSTAQELTITTDNGQSIKILEGTTDSIILQTADGDIELKSSADGDILLDPTNGKIMLKGPVEILNGNKIQSSIGGTPVVFASDIVVSGSIDITGTIEGIDLTIFSSSVNTRLTNLESSAGSLNSFTSSTITRLNSIESSTSSLNSYTSSNNTRLGIIETTTGSLNSFTSSTNTRLGAIESTTSSLNAYTSSNNTRLNSIETSTGSLNTFTSSANNRLNSIETATSSINIFTSSANSKLNAIEIATSSLNSHTASVNTKFTGIENVTSSFASYSGTTNTRLNSIETSTGSLNTFTSSAGARLSAIETSTGSLNTFTSSINTTIKNRLNTENVISGSAQVTLSNTTGYSTFSSSIAATDAVQDTRLNSIEAKTGSYATTGSNIFIGNQTITGSLFVSQDLIIAGSSSIQHISSSVVNIADNIITVNAQNPSIRFGGLAVIDSGSSPQVSGSMLFDSVNDQWIFVHQNQAVVTSSILLMGPQTFNNLGNETFPSTNRILKSVNAEHVGDSNITDTGTKVSVNSTTEITGSLTTTGDLISNANLVSNFSAGDEGGEISLNKPVTNTTLNGGITIDVWRDRVRIFESGGTNRGGFFNIANLSAGVGTNFLGTAETASFVEYANVANKPTLVSGSSQINHNATTNYDANQHVDHTAVSITAGNGLSGGGTIAATRTLTLDTGSTHFINGVKSKMNTDGVVSGSSQITYSGISGIPSGIVSGSSQITYSGLSGIPSGIVSGSVQVDLTATTNYVSGIKTRLNTENVLSSSAQVVSALPAGTVSGSSQVLNGTTIHSGAFFNGITVVSGSGQISFGGITGVPSGLVSGSSQITYGSISGIPSGIVSGSSQVSFSGLSNIPGGLVSGSSQIDLTATTNYSSGIKTRLNAEGVLSGSAQVSFGSITGVPSGLVSGSAQLSSAFLPLSGGTMTGDLRFNQGSGFGRVAFLDNYHGMILRGIPSDAVGNVTVGDFTSLIQHSGDFRFYRTNGTINELYFQVNASGLNWRGNTIWHAGNDGSGTGLDADLLDGYHETSFVRLSANSSSPTNGTFAIGSASGRNFIQSHNSQPLDLNPLGNTVFINGSEAVRNTGTWSINVTGTASSETLSTVTSRGNTTTGRINVRGIGNQSGGNILMGNTGNGSNKWSYLTGAHFNADSQPQGFALIGGLSTDTINAVVIGGNVFEANPATEIQFWTHSATTHNLGGTQRGVINSSGNWGIGTNSPTFTLQVGQNTASNNIDYGILIARHGNGATPGTYTATAALQISEMSNSGPASVDTTGIFNLGFGRFSHTMTNAGNATLMHISYDGNLGPLRVDGRGNMWVGYDRAAASTNSGTFGLLVRNGLTVGSSYQTTTPPSNGAIIAGSVGIGTSSPDNPLEVVGADSGIKISSLVTNRPQLRFECGTTENLIMSANSLYGAIGDATSADRYIVLRGGNVGINNSNPDQRLRVDGVLGQAATSGTNQNGIIRMVAFSGGGQSGYGETLDMGMHVGVSGPASYAWLQATNWSNLALNYRLVLNPNGGNVGISTTSPSSTLHVAGTITAASTSESGRINFGTDGDAIALFRDNLYDLVLQQNASSSNPVYIAGAGNVVISIDSNNNETDRAFIVGSNAVKSTNALFSVNESGNATVSGLLTENSSIRYKENIETIKYGLDKVLQMRGVTYNKKDGGTKELGLIAEEINEILPELIIYNTEGNPDSVSYGRITAVLIEAIKELKTEIDFLKQNK